MDLKLINVANVEKLCSAQQGNIFKLFVIYLPLSFCVYTFQHGRENGEHHNHHDHGHHAGEHAGIGVGCLHRAMRCRLNCLLRLLLPPALRFLRFCVFAPLNFLPDHLHLPPAVAEHSYLLLFYTSLEFEPSYNRVFNSS